MTERETQRDPAASPCDRLEESLPSLVLGEEILDESERSALLDHARSCRRCEASLRAYRRTVELVRALPRKRAPADLAARVLREIQAPGSFSESRRRRPRWAWLRSADSRGAGVGWSALPRVAAAAAAVLLVSATAFVSWRMLGPGRGIEVGPEVSSVFPAPVTPHGGLEAPADGDAPHAPDARAAPGVSPSAATPARPARPAEPVELAMRGTARGAEEAAKDVKARRIEAAAKGVEVAAKGVDAAATDVDAAARGETLLRRAAPAAGRPMGAGPVGGERPARAARALLEEEEEEEEREELAEKAGLAEEPELADKPEREEKAELDEKAEPAKERDGALVVAKAPERALTRRGAGLGAPRDTGTDAGPALDEEAERIPPAGAAGLVYVVVLEPADASEEWTAAWSGLGRDLRERYDIPTAVRARKAADRSVAAPGAAGRSVADRDVADRDVATRGAATRGARAPLSDRALREDAGQGGEGERLGAPAPSESVGAPVAEEAAGAPGAPGDPGAAGAPRSAERRKARGAPERAEASPAPARDALEAARVPRPQEPPDAEDARPAAAGRAPNPIRVTIPASRLAELREELAAWSASRGGRVRGHVGAADEKGIDDDAARREGTDDDAARREGTDDDAVPLADGAADAELLTVEIILGPPAPAGARSP